MKILQEDPCAVLCVFDDGWKYSIDIASCQNDVFIHVECYLAAFEKGGIFASFFNCPLRAGTEGHLFSVDGNVVEALRHFLASAV